MKTTKSRKRIYKIEKVNESNIEYDCDFRFGLELIPFTYVTIHMYDQFGNHKVIEKEQNLN